MNSGQQMNDGKIAIHMDLGESPGVLEFSGPDAVRFLNGQITQDVRKVMGTRQVLPSCVTDAKGRLQFRIWIAEGKEPGDVAIFCRREMVAGIEARLTRYLIADEVEVRDRSGGMSPEDLGIVDSGIEDKKRIEEGIPAWGRELKEGMLPPEAGLDATDISYNKGCYIGQEVISRIKSAGKVNRTLVKLAFDRKGRTGEFTDGEGKACGEVTSVHGEIGLGFLKRSAEGKTDFFVDDLVVRLR